MLTGSRNGVLRSSLKLITTGAYSKIARDSVPSEGLSDVPASIYSPGFVSLRFRGDHTLQSPHIFNNRFQSCRIEVSICGHRAEWVFPARVYNLGPDEIGRPGFRHGSKSRT